MTPTFPNSLFDQESGRPKTTLWICYLQINQLFLFSFLIYFFIPLNLSNSNGQGCKQFFFLERKKVRWGHYFRLRFYTAHQTKCSTGWKFVHLGVPFTGRNDLNRTKIWQAVQGEIQHVTLTTLFCLLKLPAIFHFASLIAEVSHDEAKIPSSHFWLVVRDLC